MPHMEFEVPEAQPEDDPITFTLAGRKMTCVPVMSYATRILVSAPRVYKRDFAAFIRACLVDEDQPVFDEVLEDRKYPLQDAVVDAVFWYLIDQYSEREGERIADPVPKPRG
jgi:hypothetical protein